jgi:hypothetical protein
MIVVDTIPTIRPSTLIIQAIPVRLRPITRTFHSRTRCVGLLLVKYSNASFMNKTVTCTSIIKQLLSAGVKLDCLILEQTI